MAGMARNQHFVPPSLPRQENTLRSSSGPSSSVRINANFVFLVLHSHELVFAQAESPTLFVIGRPGKGIQSRMLWASVKRCSFQFRQTHALPHWHACNSPHASSTSEINHSLTLCIFSRRRRGIFHFLRHSPIEYLCTRWPLPEEFQGGICPLQAAECFTQGPSPVMCCGKIG